MRSLCSDESEDSVGDNEAEEEDEEGNIRDPTELIFLGKVRFHCNQRLL